MLIVGYDECSIGSESAIYELVIIVVGFNQTEIEMRGYILHILALQQQVYDISSYNGRSLLLYDFLIFIEDGIRHAEDILTRLKTCPYRIELTMAG